MKKKNILFNLTGSIACYKSCFLISRLVQNGYDVQTVCTEGALQFIGEATLEGLSGHPVRKNVYEAGQMMEHINLTKWADLILLCPATANSINKLAQGVADDLVGSLFLANNFKKPYWIAPAMNVEMIRHPATLEALKKLSDWGAFIFETGVGSLACGDVGEGRLVEPDIVFEKISRYFEKAQ